MGYWRSRKTIRPKRRVHNKPNKLNNICNSLTLKRKKKSRLFAEQKKFYRWNSMSFNFRQNMIMEFNTPGDIIFFQILYNYDKVFRTIVWMQEKKWGTIFSRLVMTAKRSEVIWYFKDLGALFQSNVAWGHRPISNCETLVNKFGLQERDNYKIILAHYNECISLQGSKKPLGMSE